MDVLTFSRIQFGDTAAFHILWPLMSIGLALYLAIMEGMWLYTKDESYYRQLRFWIKIFVLTFAIGVASGFPLSFQFGTNWAAFSNAAGSFFGNILGFETTIAFTLETASLGILLFGWKRVPRAVHFIANLFVLIGASLSGFWIVAANSWMQVPHGVAFVEGKFVVTDYLAAIFNPDTLVSFAHMWLACIVATMFLVAGISAAVLLTKNAADATRAFFLHSLRYALMLIIITTPVQMIVGDMFGGILEANQPAKLAAYELHWNTNPPGTGASLNLFAWPRADGGGNVFQISVPNLLSYIVVHTPDGEVKGLNDFPPLDRPSVVDAIITFLSFRVMVGLGVVMFLIAVWGIVLWRRGVLTLPAILSRRWFLRVLVAAIPAGFIATEAGWMVREIGRQPWVVYGMMRTTDALSSNLALPQVGTSLIGLSVIYAALAVAFVVFVVRIVRRGPDLTTPIP